MKVKDLTTTTISLLAYLLYFSVHLHISTRICLTYLLAYLYIYLIVYLLNLIAYPQASPLVYLPHLLVKLSPLYLHTYIYSIQKYSIDITYNNCIDYFISIEYNYYSIYPPKTPQYPPNDLSNITSKVLMIEHQHPPKKYNNTQCSPMPNHTHLYSFNQKVMTLSTHLKTNKKTPHKLHPNHTNHTKPNKQKNNKH